MDSRARKNLSNINTELQDVHRIMVQNIEDVLVRGESLSGITLSSIYLLIYRVKRSVKYYPVNYSLVFLKP